MSRPTSANRFRIRDEHLWLVRAAVGEGSVARTSYRKWDSATSLTDLDAASHRLLPLVHRNLGESGVISDIDLVRYRKITRFTWVKTQMLLGRAAIAGEHLEAAGIPAMAVKGVAVMHHAGLGIGLRPMDDVDLAVPFVQAGSALRVLDAAGFSASPQPVDDASLQGILAGHHGLAVVDSTGVQVDVHWHVLFGSLHPEADIPVWERAEPYDLQGRSGLVTCREDTLLHTMSHSSRWSWAPSIQWLADAVLLVRGGIDWDRFTEETRRHRMGMFVADALDVLESTELASVPTGLSAKLRRVSPSLRIEGRIRVDAVGRRRPSTRVEELGDAFEEHVRRRVRPGRSPRPADGMAFLAERWALPRQRLVPAHALFVGTGRPWRSSTEFRRRVAAADLPPSRSDAPPPLTVGTELRFDFDGNGLPYLDGGWSFPEEHGTWSHGSEARLLLPLGDALGLADPTVTEPDGEGPGLRLRLTVVPFLSRLRPSRRVDVIVAGQLVDGWSFRGSEWTSEVRVVHVPADFDRHRPLEVRFIVHRPNSPEEVDHDVGTRPLGMALHALTVES